MDSHEQNRAFAPLAISLLFLATTIPAWPQSGTSLGLRSGGLIGNTELTDKAHVQTALTLRRPLLGMLLWELGAGYSRLDGTDYAANLAVGELRLLVIFPRRIAGRWS
jgi:hypothetical protein